MNVAKRPALTNSLLVRSQFGAQLDMICKGKIGELGQETQIFDARNNKRIR
jgi:tRNA A37 threonylcarbamoyladenosine synthetase subunit TsaC/SUA5/YrdC